MFYFCIVATIYFSMMMLWSTSEDCRTTAPWQWWWLLTTVVMFYLIVTFGLVSFGQHLCNVANIREEILENARKEYLEDGQY